MKKYLISDCQEWIGNEYVGIRRVFLAENVIEDPDNIVLDCGEYLSDELPEGDFVSMGF